ncbi:ATP-binding cassette domain-containing protein [Halorubrum sp. JWXQ-INN 858]|uniref:ABC transporter ATP-binding protein n=1 Tax=Halorubrum sp. JWXQ-INN 858 TaxID=2690782 RepID=UPI001356BF0A|nr:ABC transporter ATP-binding protein [Halorubrum sp. JWXQ-INN 858]MWV65448.1 ATP-binding cassette domain-containing protein [Halorubrum sp. JWXQ-INN 858]
MTTHDDPLTTRETAGRGHDGDRTDAERDPRDAPGSGDALAELSNVTRTYGGVPVLDDVSLAVRPGLTAVIGPNGSGKSTLLSTLVGAVEPTAGRVTHARGDAVRPVGYLPQRVPFRDGFTARETLAFYARLVGDDPDAALERVGLADAAERRIESLSGGMRRLLGIAQATIGDPSLVVLDEPASGLDPGMRERAFAVASARATGGAGVVLSSHDLDLVDAHADRLVCLSRGRVVAAGDRVTLLAEHDADDVGALYRALVGGSAASDRDPDVGSGGGPVLGSDSDSGVGPDHDADHRHGHEAVHVTGVSSDSDSVGDTDDREVRGR